jgi:predicted DNA-binding transcriptional regulator AlpA
MVKTEIINVDREVGYVLENRELINMSEVARLLGLKPSNFFKYLHYQKAEGENNKLPKRCRQTFKYIVAQLRGTTEWPEIPVESSIEEEEASEVS